MGTRIRPASRPACGKKTTLYGSIFYHFDRSTEVYCSRHMSLKEAGRTALIRPDEPERDRVGIRTRF